MLAPQQPPPESTGTPGAMPHQLAEKRRKGHTWLLNRISAHREKPDGEVEFRLEWDSDWAPTWELRSCVREEAVNRYFARYRRDLTVAPRCVA